MSGSGACWGLLQTRWEPVAAAACHTRGAAVDNIRLIWAFWRIIETCSRDAAFCLTKVFCWGYGADDWEPESPPPHIVREELLASPPQRPGSGGSQPSGFRAPGSAGPPAADSLLHWTQPPWGSAGFGGAPNLAPETAHPASGAPALLPGDSLLPLEGAPASLVLEEEEEEEGRQVPHVK